MKLPRLGVRSRLLVAIVAAVTMALVVAVVAFSFLLGQRLSVSATSLARAQAEAEAASLEIRDGALVTPERPDARKAGSQVWVFAGARALEAPRVSQEIDQAARSLANGADRTSPPSRDARGRPGPRSSGGRGACRRPRPSETVSRRAVRLPSQTGPAASSRRPCGPRSPACESGQAGESCSLRASAVILVPVAARGVSAKRRSLAPRER